MAAAEASRHGRAAAGVKQATDTLVVAAASAGEEHLATLVSQGGPYDRTVLERASVFVSALLLFERTLMDADNRAQSDLIADLVTARDRDDLTLNARLADYGIFGSGGFDVLVGTVDPELRYAALTAARSVIESGLLTLHSGHICILIDSAKNARAIAAQISAALHNRNIPALVGHAHAERLDLIGVAHSQAQTIVAAQKALGRISGAADATGLGLAGIVIASASTGHIAGLIDRFIGPLISYDHTHSSQLTLTAWSYLENGSKLVPTAGYLHIHPNTVRQRAERITQLLGPQWRKAPHSVDVHFALRLWRLKHQS